MRPHRNLTLFSGLFVLLAALTFLISGPYSVPAMTLFRSQSFQYMVLIALLAGLILLFIPERIARRNITITRIIFYVIFLPVIIIPLLRCYFAIPYIFCTACPRKCPWGLVRPFLIPLIVLANLEQRSWCMRMCPLGLLQDCEQRLTKRRLHPPRWLCHSRWIILIAVIIISALTLSGITSPQSGPLFNPSFSAPLIATAIIGGLLLAALLIPRPFCNYACPVGALGDLLFRLFRNRKK